jgi:lipopolysaccharide export system protein LptC
MARHRWAPYVSWAAIAAGLLLFVIFVLQAGLFEMLMPKPPAPPEVIAHPEQLAASGTSVTGFDKDKQPYTFSSKTALQDKDMPHRIHLTDISGNFRRNSGEVLTLVAQAGLYDSDVKTLDLDGAVRIVSEGRFTAEMERAHVDTISKKMTSDSPVKVVMASGTIQANGLEITNDGKNILFHDRVRAKFVTQPGQGDGKP